MDLWSNLYYDVSYPANYRKQLFSHLLTIYGLWESQLKANYKDFYLSIWVFDNRFIDSQVVAVIRDRISYYEQMWDDFKTNVSFPVDKFEHEENRIKKFDWFSTDDIDILPESDFLDLEIDNYASPEDFYEEQRLYKRLLKRNAPTRMIGDKKVFVIKQGNIWIGKK